MELLLYILLLIIAILVFLLLKKENLFKIKLENNNNFVQEENYKNKINDKKNFDELFDSIPEEILILNSSKTILFANKAAHKRFQLNINDNLNLYLRNPDLLNAIEKIFKKQKVDHIEIEVKSSITSRLKITLYLDQNKLFFDELVCLLFIRDLTEFYKFLELESDFVANVSHELRTPLQSIKLGLEILEKNKNLKEYSEVTEFLPLMISQSERMENLIRDLLTLSKIELQEHIRPIHEIDLNEVIEYVIKTHQNLLNKTNTKVSFKKLNELKIIGDKDRLIEIFSNLIENSVKYSHQNTTIEIKSKKENNLNIVKIIDQGIGIPKEFIHRVTERFFTVDPSKSRSVGGTGLGLAIVKHLISQHRGEMNIKSEVNKGTEIELKFKAL